MISFRVNGKPIETDANPETSLLMYLREEAGLTGTKYGCGAAMCGACTVHLNGKPTVSCQLKLKHIGGQEITTIEGIAEDGKHPLLQAWVAEQVPQCGYCQSGQIMRADGLLKTNPTPSEEEIRHWMSANLCRCSTYNRIVKAVQRAAKEMSP